MSTTDTSKIRLSRRSILSLGCLSAFYFSPLGSFAQSLRKKTEPDNHPPVEDGYQTWLRYNKLDSASLPAYTKHISSIVVEGDSATSNIVKAELTNALSGLFGRAIPTSAVIETGALVVLTAASPQLQSLISPSQLQAAGEEGYIILTRRDGNRRFTLIAANKDIGTLYGAFALLRLIQTRQAIDNLHIVDRPKNALRILAHSDNTNGVVDRGYSGISLWQWDRLPGQVNPRLHDYGRINASIGINGVIINKVEADPTYLTTASLQKLTALADLWRPYGLRVYLSVNFASPKTLDGLGTADPMDAAVRRWWHDKVAEIYKLIPDFGGFEVKASAEGMPGPEDYGRTHADGANMLASALAPFEGIVMYRAFVYDLNNKNVNQDRVKRAYLEFKPLDGQFADNVLVQAKNGPLDFQPREPFHPLFGAMPKTRLLGELQLNQEYLGQGTHLVYLGTMWQEFLQANTFCHAGRSSVADTIELGPQPGAGGFSATSNLGDDRNWTGHHFGQANWYVYGRLAWDPQMDAGVEAANWIKMTWSHNPAVCDIIHKIMMQSHEAYVGYTMPLGLHHMVGGDHYAPMPEGYGDPRGMFHHASADGIGYDRTRRGSDAVDEYHHPLSDNFNNPATCPEKFLLWFHHLSWDHRMHSGRTLWEELCHKYRSGTATVEAMETSWANLAPAIDSRRHAEVAAKLRQQVLDAHHWSDHCLNYFEQFSKRPIGQV